MKILDRITLYLYANIILVLSIIMILVFANILDINIINETIKTGFENSTARNVILGISIAFVLLSLRAILTDSSNKNNKSQRHGVLLENESGKLMISLETIENLVNSVALNFESAEEVSTKVMLDTTNSVIININLTVNENAIIKNLSSELQEKIKEKIKMSTDLQVKEVNINVKKVSSKKETKTQTETN